VPVYAYASLTLTNADGSAVSGAPSRARVRIGGQRQNGLPGSNNHTELLFPSSLSGSYLLNLGWSSQGPVSANNEAGFQGDLTSASQLHFAEGTVTIRSYAGISRGYWLYWLGVAFLIVVGVSFLRRWNFNRRRWSGSDWTSED
jgi:hypothetical protein